MLWFLLPSAVSGFAAKKKKGGGKKASSSSTNRGFGAPPPTLEEVVSKFRTYMPDDADDQECPCHTSSGLLYKDCCKPLHQGEKLCLRMTDVLKSRYTAFKFRNIAHVIRTTHPTCRDYRKDLVTWAKDLNKEGMFDSYEFVKLEAGSEEFNSGNENEGYVNFKVTLQAKDSTKQETIISERSTFVRNPNDGSWTYSSGDVRSDVAGLEDLTLN